MPAVTSQEQLLVAKQEPPKPGLVGAVTEVVNAFLDADGMTQAAAIAFYTGLAITPMLTLAVWSAQTFLGAEAKDEIFAVFQQILGAAAAAPIEQLLEPASEQAKGRFNVAGVASLFMLAFSASGVFGQLQSALNTMWNVKPKPGNGLILFLKKRLFSFGMLLTLLLLMMVSMVLSVLVSSIFGDHHGFAWQLIGLAVNFVGALGIFALVFTYLPDAKVPRADALVGSLVTAGLFQLGRIGLGFYLGRGDYETSYGAAVGSFVALLVWVYYTSIIILLGAEITQVRARRMGHRISPEAHAMVSRYVEVVAPDPNADALTAGASVPHAEAEAPAEVLTPDVAGEAHTPLGVLGKETPDAPRE